MAESVAPLLSGRGENSKTPARAHLNPYVARFKAKASKAYFSFSQARVKMLERWETSSRTLRGGAQAGFTYFPEPEELSPPDHQIMDAGSRCYDGPPVLRNLFPCRIDQ